MLIDKKTKIWNVIAVIIMIFILEATFFLLGFAPKGVLTYFFHGNAITIGNIIISVIYYTIFFMMMTYLTEYLLDKNVGFAKQRFVQKYLPVLLVGFVLRLLLDLANLTVVSTFKEYATVTLLTSLLSELLFYFGSFLLMIYFIEKSENKQIKLKECFNLRKKNVVIICCAIIIIVILAFWNMQVREQLALKYFPKELSLDTLTGLHVEPYSSYALTLKFAIMRSSFWFYVVSAIIIYLTLAFNTKSYQESTKLLERKTFIGKLLVLLLTPGWYIFIIAVLSILSICPYNLSDFGDYSYIHMGSYNGDTDSVYVRDDLAYEIQNSDNLHTTGIDFSVWDIDDENFYYSKKNKGFHLVFRDIMEKYDFRYTFYCYDYMKKYDPEGIRPKLEQYARGEYSQEERRNARDELLDEMTEFSKKALEEMKQQHGHKDKNMEQHLCNDHDIVF